MSRRESPPKSSLSKWLRFISILGSVCFVVLTLSFWELHSSEDKAALSTLRGQVAVIYAAPTFHDEVTSVVTCILHDLGYYTVVYIGNGWHVNGMMVPFSGRRKRSSQDFYGRCVSQFVTITTPVKHVTDPDIMVFVTYPMTQRGGVRDEYAFQLLQRLHEDKSTTPIVLVTHRTSEMFHPTMTDVEKFAVGGRAQVR